MSDPVSFAWNLFNGSMVEVFGADGKLLFSGKRGEPPEQWVDNSRTKPKQHELFTSGKHLNHLELL